MSEYVRSACPLNCPDSCTLLVKYEENGLHVRGDMEKMGTKGFICPKGRALGGMVFSSDRLKYPLLKENGNWKKINWDQAYDILTEKIKETLEVAGSQAILHMFDNGHNGALRALDRRFFQALGGVTEPRGSMCWGAGFEAQLKDFGAVYSSQWEDLLNSKTIILWGRDPAVTNKHLIPILREAADQGTQIIVVNPLRVKSTVFAHDYVRVNPGTDGVLALGLSHIVLRERWLNFEFVKDYVNNFGPYAALVKEYPPERVQLITGVSVETQENLARRIAKQGPVMFYLGYGLQRYVNGGSTIRAIDALGAITGNIGKPGAGIFYSHQYHRENLNSLLLPPQSYEGRTVPHAHIPYALRQPNSEIPIKLAFVTRCNPLATQPDTESWRHLWHEIPFKVTLDIWMSHTAKLSDLILPVATIFEEEDLLATSWSYDIRYAQKVLEPQGQARPEFQIFTDLARRLGLEAYFPYEDAKEWLAYILEPLQKEKITLERLKQEAVKAPYIPNVAWKDKDFRTPSKKIELLDKSTFLSKDKETMDNYFEKINVKTYLNNSHYYSENNAENDTHNINENINAKGQEIIKNKDSKKILYLDDYKEFKNYKEEVMEYPYILLTPHPDLALNSQFQLEEGLSAYIHPDTAATHYILPGDKIIVESEVGQAVATAYISEDIHQMTIVLPEGSTEDLIGVNHLIIGKLSDIGESTCYYDTFCQIRKWHID